MCAQLYAGIKTIVADLYSKQYANQLANMLKNRICERGAMTLLISGSVQFEISKCMTNTLLAHTGTLADTWLLAMAYACFLLNHTSNSSVCIAADTDLAGNRWNWRGIGSLEIPLLAMVSLNVVLDASDKWCSLLFVTKLAGSMQSSSSQDQLPRRNEWSGTPKITT
jgi:hypothetical protein